MDIVPYVDDMEKYLKADYVIDYGNKAIAQIADTLFQEAKDELEFIKKAYELVRDHISHSADINEDILTCSASEVLSAGHGICFAKSHLLAAILRCKSVPAGFCYQKLILDDEIAPVLIYHGLNGIYIKEYQKWIRLDARGNKKGVNAQFSVEKEQLAFTVRPEKGEEDDFVVYPNPDTQVLEKFEKNKTRTELWDNLPTELAYNLCIRSLNENEIDEALSLVWRVFLEYEAPDYSKEGIEEFYQTIHDEGYLSQLCMYGAFKGDKLVGVIATRNEGTHVALFFVDGKYHRQGIGKQLFQTIRKDCHSGKMTVNSSPYAVPVYHKLGFCDVDKEQVVSGLRFIPMEFAEK